jgi:prevent-host-death family protein
MKPSESIKPISYLKAHASEIIKDINQNHKTMIITQNGEAKVIIQDVKAYEEMRETVALLKILAMSSKSIKDGKIKKADKAFSDIENRIKKIKNES